MHSYSIYSLILAGCAFARHIPAGHAHLKERQNDFENMPSSTPGGDSQGFGSHFNAGNQGGGFPWHQGGQGGNGYGPIIVLTTETDYVTDIVTAYVGGRKGGYPGGRPGGRPGGKPGGNSSGGTTTQPNNAPATPTPQAPGGSSNQNPTSVFNPTQSQGPSDTTTEPSMTSGPSGGGSTGGGSTGGGGGGTFSVSSYNIPGCSLPVSQDQVTMLQGDNDHVAMHNSYRKYHNVPSMTLDQSAAAAAASCVSNPCLDAHPDGFASNLYWSSGSPSPGEVAHSWYNELANYTTFSNGFTTEPPWEPCNTQIGHFSQMVWDQSTGLGCATSSSQCGSGKFAGMYTTICIYSPGGNMLGDFHDHVSAPNGIQMMPASYNPGGYKV